MFLLLLSALVIAGLVHARLRDGSLRGNAAAETVLVYLLVRYCGLPQIAVGLSMSFAPQLAGHLARVNDLGELLPWIAWLYTGAALAATLAIRLRGDYLTGPVVLWSVFFAGATYAHLHTEAMHARSPGVVGVLWIFATHGLVSVLLVGAWWASRRARPVASPATA